MTDLFDTLLRFVMTRKGATPECCNVTLARPYRDWAIIASAALIFFVCIAAYDVWEYFSVTETVEVDLLVGTKGVGPSTQELRKELSQFEALEVEHASLLSSPLQLSDPAK